MSLTLAGTSLRDFVIDNITGFTTDNCSWIDEKVFDYVQTTPGGPVFCAIVDYGGMRPDNRAREFSSLTINWSLFVNYYYTIPSDGDYIESYNAGVTFIDSMMVQLAQDSTLGGTVLGSSPIAGGPPVVYQRGSHYYILFDIEVYITDNIT